ncbi:MAG TPA: rod shape-determining protein MreC [Chryseosolibacter sp.]
MERLFLFFYQYRAFFTFLVIEVICAWLIIQNNQYQSARFFNSSSSMVASLNNFSQDVREYFLLRNINSTLAEENAVLRSKLEQFNQLQQASDSISRRDSSVIRQFDFISAKVVNNSVNRFTNYLTINKGSDAGVKPGMAVISPLGAVGKVKAVSNHYSVVTSILHKDYKLSVLMTRTGYFGSVSWDGRDPDFAQLNFVPRHVNPAKGDTVVTSSYNAVFPEGIMVGIIEDVKQNPTLFYDLTVRLSQDFRKLSYVEVVRSHLKNELDSLQGPFLEEGNK